MVVVEVVGIKVVITFTRGVVRGIPCLRDLPEEYVSQSKSSRQYCAFEPGLRAADTRAE